MRPVIAFVILSSACATPGTRPHDMSVSGHTEAANAAERAGSPQGAAEHRAAAAALRAAEADACDGLTTADRENSPLLVSGAVLQTTPLYTSTSSKSLPRMQVGGSVVLRAERGVTREWLQRTVNCHIARNALGEGEAAAMRDCPLAVRHVSAAVRPVDAGFEVAISANDQSPDTAKEVWRRVSHLSPTH